MIFTLFDTLNIKISESLFEKLAFVEIIRRSRFRPAHNSFRKTTIHFIQIKCTHNAVLTIIHFEIIQNPTISSKGSRL